MLPSYYVYFSLIVGLLVGLSGILPEKDKCIPATRYIFGGVMLILLEIVFAIISQTLGLQRDSSIMEVVFVIDQQGSGFSAMAGYTAITIGISLMIRKIFQKQ